MISSEGKYKKDVLKVVHRNSSYFVGAVTRLPMPEFVNTVAAVPA